jgi:hypothetical protein
VPDTEVRQPTAKEPRVLTFRSMAACTTDRQQKADMYLPTNTEKTNVVVRESDSQKAFLEFATFDLKQGLVPASHQGPLDARQNNLGSLRLFPSKKCRDP